MSIKEALVSVNCADCKMAMKKSGKPYVKICGITYQNFKCPKCKDTVNIRIK